MQCAPESEERPLETSREPYVPSEDKPTEPRRLEKVRSSKNLLLEEELANIIPVNELSKVAEDEFDTSKILTPEKATSDDAIVPANKHHSNQLEKENSGGRNNDSMITGAKTHNTKLVRTETHRLEVDSGNAASGNDDKEPTQPEIASER